MSFEEHNCLFLLDRYLGVELLAHGKFIYIYIYIYIHTYIYSSALILFHKVAMPIYIFINKSN